MHHPTLDWNGTGRYDWRADFPIGNDNLDPDTIARRITMFAKKLAAKIVKTKKK